MQALIAAGVKYLIANPQVLAEIATETPELIADIEKLIADVKASLPQQSAKS